MNVQLRMIRPEDVEALKRAASADQHPVVFPTHVADRDGEIVGYASIGAIPMVHCWMDRGRSQAFESFRMLRAVEDAARPDVGTRTICVPCAHDSPFLAYLPRLDYRRLGFSSINLKRLEAK